MRSKYFRVVFAAVTLAFLLSLFSGCTKAPDKGGADSTTACTHPTDKWRRIGNLNEGTAVYQCTVCGEKHYTTDPDAIDNSMGKTLDGSIRGVRTAGSATERYTAALTTGDLFALMAMFDGQEVTDGIFDCECSMLDIRLGGNEYDYCPTHGAVKYEGKRFALLNRDDRAAVNAICKKYEDTPVYSPVSLLPERMPEDFAIHYETWIIAKNIYDTYEGYVQKDLVLDGTKRVTLKANDGVLADIYANVRHTCLDTISREMTTAVLATGELQAACSPMTYYSITFTANGKIYTVKGDWTASVYTETDADAANFWNFTQYMSGLLYNCDEYRDMPEPNGGYD